MSVKYWSRLVRIGQDQSGWVRTDQDQSELVRIGQDTTTSKNNAFAFTDATIWNDN